MISGLSKAVTLYLAPLLALTAIILSALAYLAPTLLLHDQVALLTVFPSTGLIQNGSSQDLDGPSVFLGALGMESHTKISVILTPPRLGSCARASNSGSVNCTAPSVSPLYGMINRPCRLLTSRLTFKYLYSSDLSVLPGNAPGLLTAPTASTPVFIAIALSFSILFFLSFTLISLRHKMNPKMAGLLEKPMLQRLSAWVGFFGFLIGMSVL